MMRDRLKTTLVLMLSVLALLAVSCADGASNLSKGTDDTGGLPDAMSSSGSDAPDTRMLPDSTVTESDRLVLVTPSPLKIARNGDGIFRVRFETSEGLPIPAAYLKAEILSSTDECHLAEVACVLVSNAFAETAADGLAEFSLRGRSKDANVILQFSVDGAEGIDPIEAELQIRAKDSYDLIVEFNYEGGRQFQSVQPRLYTTEASSTDPNPPQTCADVYKTVSPRTVNDFHQAEAGVPHPEVARNPDGSINPATYISLRTTQQYLAAGYAKTPTGDTVFVYGCSDTPPDDSTGSPKMVVDLIEVPVLVAGDYALVSNFDLLTALPHTDVMDPTFGDYQAGDWIRFIIELFENPGNAIVGMLLQIDVIDDALGGTIEVVVVSLINEAIEQFAPDWLQDTFNVGSDIGALLTDLQLEGTISIVEEPADCGDERGDNCLPLTQTHSYNAVTFQWSLDLPTSSTFAQACGPAAEGGNKITCNIQGLTGDPTLSVSGTWEGSFDESTGLLDIEPHGVQVPYGSILLGVIENLALPAIFGPSVTSIGGMVEHVILGAFVDFYNGRCDTSESYCPIVATGCDGAGEALARLLLGDNALSSLLGSVTGAICVQGIDLIQGYVDDFAASLVLDTGDGLTFATPEGAACQMYDSDLNLQYDKMGNNDTAENRCVWDMQLNLGGYQGAIDGRFHSVLK